MMSLMNIIERIGNLTYRVKNKEIFEPHLLFFNTMSINELFNKSQLKFIALECFGRLIDEIKLKPFDKIITDVKHFIRKEIIPDGIMRFIRKNIVQNNNIVDYDEEFKLRVVGDKRQWIRAITRLNSEK
jgi:hypothetical protein